MATNTATYSYVNGSIYSVKVNNYHVYYAQSGTDAQTITNRLNCIFSDTNRDLDFITPSIINGYYSVICPLVRKNQGHITYFNEKNANGTCKSYNEKLYENTYWSDSRNTNQTAILQVTGSSPWYDALLIANNIRYAVSPNFNTASGSQYITKFTVPSNISSTVASTISSSAHLEFYGSPCQGTQCSNSYYCSTDNLYVENIWSATVANGEVFHPCDAVCAMTSTNSWSTTYRNKFIKVTNLSNGKSVVVRVVDQSPANKGVELSYRAWKEIGSPSTGSNKVKIELMA